MWHYAFFTAGIQSKMTETCVMREPENRKEADRKRSERFMLNAEKIKEYIKEKYNLNLTGEEMMFLTIHLKRISTN